MGKPFNSCESDRHTELKQRHEIFLDFNLKLAVKALECWRENLEDANLFFQSEVLEIFLWNKQKKEKQTKKELFVKNKHISNKKSCYV